MSDPTSPVLRPDMITDSPATPAWRCSARRARPRSTGCAAPPSTAIRASIATTASCRTSGRAASASATSCSPRGRLRRLRGQRVPRPARRDGHQRAGERRSAWRGRVRSRRRAHSAGARNVAFQRVLQTQTRDEFDGDYKSLQISFQRRMATAGARGSPTRCRRATTWASAIRMHGGCGWTTNPCGLRAIHLRPPASVRDERHLQPVAVVHGGRRLSAITGAPINETVGTDVNGDQDNTDRPIQGVNDLTCPSARKSTARAAP